jgi:drug/metabolite transporter (DMT)-like permease
MSALVLALRGRIDPLPFQVAAFCLLWSSAFSAAKVALADCPPLLLLTARFLLAGGLMLGAAAVHGAALRMPRRDLLAFAALGIANNALYLGLNFFGMRTVSAGLAALIASANPVLTAVLAAAFLDERMTWRKAAGLALGVGGVAFVVESRLASGAESLPGVGLMVAGLAALVGGTILFKRLAPGGSLWVGNGVQNLAGGLALAPFAAGFERVGDIVPSWRLAVALAYMVLLVSIFGYLLWFHLLAVSGATAASAYHFLMPPLGMLFGWLLLDERIAAPDLIGIVPVALGIYLVTRPAARSPHRAHNALAQPGPNRP